MIVDESDDEDGRPARKRRMAEKAAEGLGDEDEEVRTLRTLPCTSCSAINNNKALVECFGKSKCFTIERKTYSAHVPIIRQIDGIQKAELGKNTCTFENNIYKVPT